MTQRLIPGVGYVDESWSAQRLVPGAGYVSGTTSGGGADATAPGATLTGTATIAAGAASGGSAGSAPGATLTGTATITGGVATGGSGGTLTTLPMKNNTGTLLAGETGIVLNIYNQSTGVLVVQKTGVTTNASGIATVTDGLIVGGTTYAYEPVLTGGRRRLPLKAAT